ncbi:MAG: TetR/AcrR family transcriptional regulator C-terminal domain-containing protein [Clostridiales bacterium]|nr:TetR/AcrR family transcriptional regulator C-terminal domain-containing protein [Clostridiales bacterium]
MKHEITSLNTKRTLAESLKNVMKRKSFSKITVSEIIADCGLNRKTFYYHFEDIFSLLKWMFESEAIEVVKQFDLLVEYEEALAFIMDYIEQNDYILSCAYDDIGRDQMKRFFFADFIELIASLIDSAEREAGRCLDAEYKQFLGCFYTEALAGMLLDWMKNYKDRNRQQVIDYLVHTMKASMTGILTQAPVREAIQGKATEEAPLA